MPDQLSELLQGFINGAVVVRPRCDCGQARCFGAWATAKLRDIASNTRVSTPDFQRLVDLFNRGMKR